MGRGVEWAAHYCVTLGWLPDDKPVSTARLAARFDLPAAYLNKQLQALVRAGILDSVPGAGGGFRLARPLERITLMDVVSAIEGRDDAFECTEIRQRGSGAQSPASAFREPCGIATAMREAELEWRRALAARTLADMRAGAERALPSVGEQTRRWFENN